VADCDACDGFRLCAPQNRATNAGEFRIPSRRRCRLRPPHSHYIRAQAVAASSLVLREAGRDYDEDRRVPAMRNSSIGTKSSSLFQASIAFIVGVHLSTIHRSQWNQMTPVPSRAFSQRRSTSRSSTATFHNILD